MQVAIELNQVLWCSNTLVFEVQQTSVKKFSEILVLLNETDDNKKPL